MRKKTKTQKNKEIYTPSEEDRELIAEISEEIEELIDIRNQTYPHFNDRTLQDFLDDSDKRLNSYVLSKESQEKEDWQSNVALPTNRDKLKKLIAGFSMSVPESEFKAYGELGEINLKRADIAKWLVKGSYLESNNPTIDSFWESWEAGSKGTIVVYEGYSKTKREQRFIKAFDVATGKIEVDKKEVTIDNKCVSSIVPLTELFIGNIYEIDIQKQPKLAWIKYLTKDVFEYEFGNYKNANHVLDRAELTEADTEGHFYKTKWSEQVNAEDKIEVIRYYNKLKDQYIIIANGVLLLEAPLLWMINGEKVYPFAKQILEPFTGKQFFYGNSLPNILMGEYDILNTVWNTLMDKQFRSMEKPLLVGHVNQDALELEDEIVSNRTKIYVDDVSQIVPMPVDGPQSADFAMLQLISEGISNSLPSIPDLLAEKKNITAREVVIAEEKMRELKSSYGNFMADLWRQKYALRLANIQLHYPEPEIRYNSKTKKKEKYYKTYLIENAVINDQTEERGTLAIQFRDIPKKDKKKIQEDIAVEEQLMELQGMKYKKVIIPRHFLDNYKYRVNIVSEALYKESLAKKQTTILEKIGTIAKLFPQIFVINQEDYFRQVAEAYDDDPEKYIEEVNKLRQIQAQASEVGVGEQEK